MEKDIFTIKESTLSYGRGYVYSLQYHLVWCTKYRKQVLKNGLDAEWKKMLYELAEIPTSDSCDEAMPTYSFTFGL